MKINLSLNKNKHVNATDINNFQTVLFKSGVEQLPFDELSEIINSYEVYEEEKEKCEDYRLNITINPYLTNILANKITEVVDKESGVVVSDNITKRGLIQNIDDEKYEYKLGYDIFDNYYHRMDTFKISDEGLSFFKNSTDLFDLKSIQESIKDNLIIDNGWLCFLNKVKIGGRKMFKTIEPNNKVYLYPTRDCFLFNPIKTKNGLVENWSHFLTYPYKNITDNILTHSDDKINGIPIVKSELVTHDDNNYVEVTTLYTHNLNRGDVIKFKNGTNKTYLVYNAGGVNKDNKKHKITLDADKYYDLVGIYESLKEYRLVRVIDKIESQYYIREFKKLPNLMMETYQPGFANNVYSDPIFQIQYLDSINLEDTRDNLGRPISEIYLTILKNTKNEEDSAYPNSDFTKLISGFDINQIEGDYSNYNIHTINKPADSTKALENDIKSSNDTFMGDIVEYNSATCNEITLEDVHYRFNTIQREGDSKAFEYMNDTLEGYNEVNIAREKEGYYYKSHYRIKIKEFSDALFSREMLNLDSCNEGPILLPLKASDSAMRHGKNILTFKDLDVRGLKNGDRLRVKVYEGDELVKKSIITISSINEVDRTFKTDFDLTRKDGYTFTFHKINDPTIPDYCDDINNKVVWRELKKIDNIFTNGNIYLNSVINFYLKRQDPFGEYGVRYENFPADVYGRRNKIQIIDEIVERIEDDC